MSIIFESWNKVVTMNYSFLKFITTESFEKKIKIIVNIIFSAVNIEKAHFYSLRDFRKVSTIEV